MSTDGTPQIAKQLGARVLNLDKPGVGYATYLAVDECKGEIIIRTDADTIFLKDITSFTVAMLRDRSKLIAYASYVYYDGGFIENVMAFYHDK